MNASQKRTLSIDFDGVLHAYDSGWGGIDVILDPPVEGALEWLRSLIGDDSPFEPVIFSARSRAPEGIAAMKAWLRTHGMTKQEIDSIGFASVKPSAFLTLDDRAMTFTGSFPSHEEMLAFKPWNKR